MQSLLYNLRRLTATACAIVLSACLLTSCIYEDEPEPNTEPETVSFISIALDVPVPDNAKPISRANGGYQDGDMLENYIDVNRNDYRIYFFDEDNKLITQFVPSGFKVVEGTNYRRYEINGLTPKQLERYRNFKVMVAANWFTYPTVTPGQHTVDDVCNSVISRFDCLTNHELSITERRLIPMYGIHEYKDVTFELNKTTTLDEPITMLRAMAKVEVILDVEQDIEISDVTLNGHNARGYSAPQGVYSQADYGQGLDWENDYLHRLHLENGANDPAAPGRKLSFRCVNKRTTDQKETWVAYIPEYRNVAADGTAAPDEAFIDLHLNIQDQSETPFRIYFADYGTNGSTGSAGASTLKRMDIERNNIYRFTLNLVDNRLVIYARQWNYRPQPSITL